MKVLVTGSNGQLGHDVIMELNKRGYDALGVDIKEMDITDSASVESVFNGFGPDAVVHCAAWTAVDAAENNADACRLVNAKGTGNIADACKRYNTKLVYLSTDYVFNGEGETPWKPDDKCEPLNVYGLTKYEGELEVKRLEKFFILRISWVFGKNGKNFVKTVLGLIENHNVLNFVDDQTGTPTYTPDLSRLICDMLETEKYGVYHVSNEGGYISWYDFVLEILKQVKRTDVTVNPVSSDEFKTPAKRPHNSRLDKSKLAENGFKPLPDWKDALKRYLTEIGDNNESD
ncbi:MAG: dTDP-4-dehydrorhamnose reductase [Eubacterium sp.]|nr:dTDP-4-dehydrorhamnose reductase [Eubacterium sp.]